MSSNVFSFKAFKDKANREKVEKIKEEFNNVLKEHLKGVSDEIRFYTRTCTSLASSKEAMDLFVLEMVFGLVRRAGFLAGKYGVKMDDSKLVFNFKMAYQSGVRGYERKDQSQGG